ncbi:uncharacterized protein I303_103414 [Kwoniella dejecticola CBS 10117]|uniref:U3 small nucleolar RNA-associated protein 6 n=1 Tax=Kwoniella dejecticola CBS 10117 TaxID=1296121 RepID=A0A1A6A6P1_9TREE|nr:U3 small nucleolar RNA-associated protein 6 [Kwoniella dejecticola CBS 10117]OBR85725.1 U3 small nucleolar RNA-associated protein 6 [Kwoniella dejecticola CBS 10117]
MEKVQFQLEATLPELKDLYEKGLFTRSEINQITKKRTSFETSLIRRNIRKEDFFKYAEYEINLERLRKVRYKKLKYHLNPPPPSASSFSLPRRALYILKRATGKFPSDLSTWLAYVEYASREGMRKIVGKGLNNALQHHPTSPTLYLLQTYYHLHPGSPFPREAIPSTSKLDLPSASATQPPGFAIEGIDPARTTLLLGLRLLPQSRDLWREYIKLELGWVEALRRRWALLGITETLDPKDAEGYDGDINALKGGEGDFGPEGEDARKAILAGQLVVHALNSALDAIPPHTHSEEGDGLDFRSSLINMFRRYPSPLRSKCLEVLYEEVGRIGITSSPEQGQSKMRVAKARLMVITKGLYDREYYPENEEREGGEVVLQGVELVEELGKIGKEIRKSLKADKDDDDWKEVVGLWLISMIGRFRDNAELTEYLQSILSTITKPSSRPPVSLLVAHLESLSYPNLDLARSFAAIHPSKPAIQLHRLQAEIANSTNAESLRETLPEVARQVTKSGLNEDERDQARTIWRMWASYVGQDNDDAALTEQGWKLPLKESLRLDKNVPGIHGDVLGLYINHSLRGNGDIKTMLEMVKSYQPTFETYRIIFTSLDPSIITPGDLKKVYDSWRIIARTSYEKAQAALLYAKVLLSIQGQGRAAFDVVETTKREVREDEGVLVLLEKEWKALIDAEAQDEDEDDDEEMDESD